jgi:hypothetical protein
VIKPAERWVAPYLAQVPSELLLSRRKMKELDQVTNRCEEAAEGAQREKITNFDI